MRFQFGIIMNYSFFMPRERRNSHIMNIACTTFSGQQSMAVAKLTVF